MKLIKEYYEYSGALIALTVVILTLLFAQGESHQAEDTVIRTISIGETVQPYTTDTRRNTTLRFRNTMDDPVKVTFESGIEDFTVKPYSSKKLKLSEYNDLSAKNYYSAGSEGGRVIFSEN